MKLSHSSVHHIHRAGLPYMFVANLTPITWTRLIRVSKANSDVQSTTSGKHPGCILLQGFYIGCMRGMLVCDNSLPVCHMTSTMGCGMDTFYNTAIKLEQTLFTSQLTLLWIGQMIYGQQVQMAYNQSYNRRHNCWQCTYTRCHVTSSNITTSIGERIWPFTCHLYLNQTRELHLLIHEKSIRA